MLYSPDPHLSRRLREIDPTLRLVWDNRQERWKVMGEETILEDAGELNGGALGVIRVRPYVVTVCQTKDRRYMSPDGRLLATMEMVVSLHRQDWNAMRRIVDENNEKLKDSKDAAFYNEITYMGQHDYKQWCGDVSLRVPEMPK